MLAHGYGQVDDARVWDMIENDLPETLAEIEHLLAER
ncbi:MAG: HepT-like ribonuclease domain-containing protein [Fimbriimonadales bacterium]